MPPVPSRLASPSRGASFLAGGRILGLAACLLSSGCSDAIAWLSGEPPEDESALLPGAEQGIVGHGVWHGMISRAQGTTYLVARTPEEWQALWDLAGQPVPGPMPSRFMALGVFLGARTSSRMGVDITSIQVERHEGVRDRLVVQYHEVERIGQVSSAYTMSSPYAIMLMDLSDVPVRFIRG